MPLKSSKTSLSEVLIGVKDFFLLLIDGVLFTDFMDFTDFLDFVDLAVFVDFWLLMDLFDLAERTDLWLLSRFELARVVPNFMVELLLFSIDLSLETLEFDAFLTFETLFFDKLEIELVLFLLIAPLAFRYFSRRALDWSLRLEPVILLASS